MGGSPWSNYAFHRADQSWDCELADSNVKGANHVGELLRNVRCRDRRFERQRCDAMSMNPLPANRTPYAPFSSNTRPPPPARLPSDERRSRSGGRHTGRHTEWTDWENARQSVADVIDPGVKICPSDIVRRRTMTSHGMSAEIVQATRRDKIEYRFRAPVHRVHDGFRDGQ